MGNAANVLIVLDDLGASQEPSAIKRLGATPIEAQLIFLAFNFMAFN
jgi:hypothetical protein